MRSWILALGLPILLGATAPQCSPDWGQFYEYTPDVLTPVDGETSYITFNPRETMEYSTCATPPTAGEVQEILGQFQWDENTGYWVQACADISTPACWQRWTQWVEPERWLGPILLPAHVDLRQWISHRFLGPPFSALVYPSTHYVGATAYWNWRVEAYWTTPVDLWLGGRLHTVTSLLLRQGTFEAGELEFQLRQPDGTVCATRWLGFATCESRWGSDRWACLMPWNTLDTQ